MVNFPRCMGFLPSSAIFSGTYISSYPRRPINFLIKNKLCTATEIKFWSNGKTQLLINTHLVLCSYVITIDYH
ncbi:hypothetical protein GDO81_007826 [Engystomops pustulosus]|uniref:Uncharacterized protein n=1 Tax=Engystomops pustulosus TaxID=76066 RepID=A0AAV7C9Y3_ENGPU|nr:hypothetical protein GDO81_007826 [Engystomops pustulosus]